MNQQKKYRIEILPIKAEDMLSVFELSNAESVRVNSFNAKPIELSSHREWFAKKLKDPNIVMIKATVDGNFAGQSRLEIEGKKALVGISVDEKFRGLGLASKLIFGVIIAARKRDVTEIEAYIKPENQASIHLFEKCGFVFDSETEVSGCKALKYLYKVNQD